jgi:hypothetical protein
MKQKQIFRKDTNQHIASRLLWLLLWLLPVISFAQTAVTGTVSDASGEIIAGANVVEKGTRNSAVTDINGNYALTVKDKAVLQVSFLGFATREVKVSDAVNGRLDVTLSDDARALDEVVVVGYGTQRKVSVVAAITTIEPAKLKTGTTRSLSNNLVGNLGGIIGVQRSGEPGHDNSNFWIRGISTFGANQNPLVLIDGIERSLDNIDVQEIESLSVLKDAADAAARIPELGQLPHPAKQHPYSAGRKLFHGPRHHRKVPHGLRPRALPRRELDGGHYQRFCHQHTDNPRHQRRLGKGALLLCLRPLQ